MPQGVVRDDGGLTQAHALKNCFAAPAVGGPEQKQKKPGHHSRLHAQMNLFIGLGFTRKRAAIPIPLLVGRFQLRFIAKWRRFVSQGRWVAAVPGSSELV